MTRTRKKNGFNPRQNQAQRVERRARGQDTGLFDTYARVTVATTTTFFPRCTPMVARSTVSTRLWFLFGTVSRSQFLRLRDSDAADQNNRCRRPLFVWFIETEAVAIFVMLVPHRLLGTENQFDVSHYTTPHHITPHDKLQSQSSQIGCTRPHHGCIAPF